jgi:hypothetical protein
MFQPNFSRDSDMNEKNGTIRPGTQPPISAEPSRTSRIFLPIKTSKEAQIGTVSLGIDTIESRPMAFRCWNDSCCDSRFVKRMVRRADSQAYPKSRVLQGEPVDHENPNVDD